MISYARNTSVLAENKNSVCPKNTPTFIKGIMGVAFPITSFDFIRADFCWNK